MKGKYSVRYVKVFIVWKLTSVVRNIVSNCLLDELNVCVISGRSLYGPTFYYSNNARLLPDYEHNF